MIGATSFAKVTADEAARAGAWPLSVTLAPMAAAATNPPHAPTGVRPFIAFLRIKNSARLFGALKHAETARGRAISVIAKAIGAEMQANLDRHGIDHFVAIS